MFTYWFSSPEKINYFINYMKKSIWVADRKFQFVSLLLWCNFHLAKSPFHVFSYPERTERSHYLKKGQARSSIKIFNKAKIILIIINGNVDFTIKSRSARPVTAPLTRPPISPDLTGCLWFPLNDGENRFWQSTG